MNDRDDIDSADFLLSLQRIIQERIASGDSDSYTAMLVAAGNPRMAQKVGEEGVEVALAAVAGDRQDLIDESSDLVYHLLVLLQANEISLADIALNLRQRHRAEANK